MAPSSLRRITHSTSLRASGSVIVPSTLVASSCRFLRDEIDGLLDGGEIDRRRRCGRRHGEGLGGPQRRRGLWQDMTAWRRRWRGTAETGRRPAPQRAQAQSSSGGRFAAADLLRWRDLQPMRCAGLIRRTVGRGTRRSAPAVVWRIGRQRIAIGAAECSTDQRGGKQDDEPTVTSTFPPAAACRRPASAAVFGRED